MQISSWRGLCSNLPSQINCPCQKIPKHIGQGYLIPVLKGQYRATFRCVPCSTDLNKMAELPSKWEVKFSRVHDLIIWFWCVEASKGCRTLALRESGWVPSFLLEVDVVLLVSSIHSLQGLLENQAAIIKLNSSIWGQESQTEDGKLTQFQVKRQKFPQPEKLREMDVSIHFIFSTVDALLLWWKESLSEMQNCTVTNTTYGVTTLFWGLRSYTRSFWNGSVFSTNLCYFFIQMIPKANTVVLKLRPKQYKT